MDSTDNREMPWIFGAQLARQLASVEIMRYWEIDRLADYYIGQI